MITSRERNVVQNRGGSQGELSEELVTLEKRKKCWRMNCDVGEAKEGLENELWHRWSDGKVGECAELHLRHSSFSNPSVTSLTSQLILQSFRWLTYVTVHSPTLVLLLLRHRLFTCVTWRAANDCQLYCMVVKLGLSLWERNKGLGCSRIKRLERYMGLIETKLLESGESYIILSYIHCILHLT